MSCPSSFTIGSERGRAIALLLGLAAVVPLAGCAGTGSPVSRQQFVAYSAQQKAELAQAEAAPYRLQRGDVIGLDFLYQEELNQDQIIVLPDGSVQLMGVDRVMAAGHTITELDSLLTELYGKNYLNPDLSIIVREIAQRRVYVLGEVERPGLVEVPPGGIDLVSAVTVAGGFTQNAKKDAAVLVRTTPEGYLCQEINLDSFHHADAGPLALVHLQSYDVVYVPRSHIGDFAYFTSTILRGLLDMTGVAMNAAIVANPDYLRRR